MAFNDHAPGPAAPHAPGPATGARVARVVLVDDHERYREGLEWRLGADDRFHIAATATSVTHAAAAIRTARPDVAVVDLNLPDGDALDVAAAIAGDGLPTRVLVLSAEPDSPRANQAARVLRTSVASKELPRRALANLIHARAERD